MRSHVLLPLLLAAVLTAACKREPERLESYLRLDDPAPRALALREGEAELVAMWASWCAPCVREVPALVALAKDPPKGLRVTVVSVDEPPDGAREKFPRAIRVVSDEEGELAEELGVDSLPVSFLVRGDRLLARFEGARDWDEPPARATIERLLATEPTSVDRGKPEG